MCFISVSGRAERGDDRRKVGAGDIVTMNKGTVWKRSSKRCDTDSALKLDSGGRVRRAIASEGGRQILISARD